MAGEDPLATLEDPRIGVGLAALENPETQEDFRESAEFESLESEFRKMETGGPNAVRWKQLNDDTVKVLQSSSKDLVLATRLAFGLFVEEGYRGLAVGLVILRDMTGAHWETMIPPVRRERGRAGAFDWLAEKLAPMVEAKKPDSKANAEVHIAHEALLELDNSLEQKMTKSQVALGPLVRALRPYARDAKAALEEVRKAAEAAARDPAEAATPPPAEEASAQADQAAADGSAQSAAVETPQPAAAAPAAATSAPPAPAPVTPVAAIEVDTSNASAAIQSVFNAATKAASTLRREALTDARGYHAARFALWGTVEGPPPHQNGKTALPPPQKNKIAEIAALKSAGNMEGLINSAESAFVTSPFWLDTQFFLTEAMTGAGPAYEAARLLVVSELSAFLRRVPDIAGLTFSDGTAFASMETREWVARVVQAGGGGSVPSGSDLDKAFSAAVQQALAGKPADGLTVLKNHVSGCGAGRDWFKAQLKIGEFCLRFDLVHPLFALLGSLRAIAVERDLAHWEPELAIALARLSWQSLGHKNAKQMLPDADALKLRANLMETLSLLDVAEAAELAGRK